MARKEDVMIRRRRKVDPSDTAEPAASSESDRSSIRRYGKRRRTRRRWIRILALAVTAILVALIIANWDVTNPEYVWTWVRLQVTGGDVGDGFPREMEGNTVQDMEPVGRQLAVVTDDYLLMYNKTAGETVRRPCSFANPALSVAGKYALVAEIGGHRLRLETVSRTQLELETPDAIVEAAVAEDGTIAVVVDSSSYQSEVWVYDRKGKVKYHWSSASTLVMGVDIRGNTMTLIGTNTSGGGLQSELLLMDITSDAAPTRFPMTDTLFFAVELLPNGKAFAIGDTGALLVDPKTQQSRPITYESSRLLGYDVSKNRLGLLLSSYGSADGGVLAVYNDSGDCVHTTPFSGNGRWIADDADGGFLVLTSSNLHYVKDGGESGVLGRYSDGLRVTCFEGQAIVLGLTRMEAVEY